MAGEKKTVKTEDLTAEQCVAHIVKVLDKHFIGSRAELDQNDAVLLQLYKLAGGKKGTVTKKKPTANRAARRKAAAKKKPARRKK